MVKLNKAINDTEVAVEINSLVNEIDLYVRANYEMKARIKDSKEHMEEQQVLINKISTKVNEVQGDMKKAGYIKDTPKILEYKRLNARKNKMEKHLNMMQKRQDKRIVSKKREVEEKQLEHDMLEDRIVNQDELISEQRQRLLDLVEIAKANQSAHGVMILERIRQGIEEPEKYVFLIFFRWKSQLFTFFLSILLSYFIYIFLGTCISTGPKLLTKRSSRGLSKSLKV